MLLLPTATASPAASTTDRETALREAAQALEAGFLSVMLHAAGMGNSRQSFGGGAGEAQFASFLVDQHAEALARRGGVGLAESIFRSLQERGHVAA